MADIELKLLTGPKRKILGLVIYLVMVLMFNELNYTCEKNFLEFINYFSRENLYSQVLNTRA